MKFFIISICCLLLFPLVSLSQKIDNTVAFRDIKSDKYFRISYDNDYFSGTDMNYTQGYNRELVAPFFKKNPVNFIFIKASENTETRYGIALEHIGFTPPIIGDPEIQYEERPFAAAIMLKSFSIATDTLNHSRLISSFNLGIIGPGALGKEMQVVIHKITGNTIPKGWRNQIKNDIVITYELDYEKELLEIEDRFSLQGNSGIRAGTLYTNASVGLETTMGIINSPFTPIHKNKDFKFFGYAQVLGSAIGYDATLQGGVFNSDSNYTIPDNEIERFTGQFNYGLVMHFRGVYMEYFRAVLTREFEKGTPTKWGGIRIGFQL